MFFQPDIQSIYKNSAEISTTNSIISKILSGTVYKKESIQRNMDTKMLLLNGIKNKMNKINNS